MIPQTEQPPAAAPSREPKQIALEAIDAFKDLVEALPAPTRAGPRERMLALLDELKGCF